MKDIEKVLRSARPTSAAAADAAKRFAQRAEEAGLLDVAYTTLDSPFGPLLVAATHRGLVRIALHPEQPDEVLAELADRVSPRVMERAERIDAIRRELDDYFEGRRRTFDLPLDWTLTRGFARRVLDATARIPYGSVSTYRDVAARAGNPRAMRAAGNALGSNPIPIVVPCHRVIRTGGSLGNYGGGVEMKASLLRLEGAIER